MSVTLNSVHHRVFRQQVALRTLCIVAMTIMGRQQSPQLLQHLHFVRHGQFSAVQSQAPGAVWNSGGPAIAGFHEASALCLPPEKLMDLITYSDRFHVAVLLLHQLHKASEDELLEVTLPQLFRLHPKLLRQEALRDPEPHQLPGVDCAAVWEACHVEQARFDLVGEVIDAHGHYRLERVVLVVAPDALFLRPRRPRLLLNNVLLLSLSRQPSSMMPTFLSGGLDVAVSTILLPLPPLGNFSTMLFPRVALIIGQSTTTKGGPRGAKKLILIAVAKYKEDQHKMENTTKSLQFAPRTLPLKRNQVRLQCHRKEIAQYILTHHRRGRTTWR